MKKIIPAILTNEVSDLEKKLQSLEGLTDWVQIDIMDGKLVNNTSITLEDIENITIAKDFSLEAHLMVLDPEAHFSACVKAGIKRIIFHAEAVADMKKTLLALESLDVQKGVALNPQTPLSAVLPYVEQLDVVLLMSVNPGLQGQEFINETMDKITELKSLAPNVKIEVDGGINLDNIAMVADAGADYLVVGSGLLKSENIEEQFKKLTEKIRE